MGDRQRISSGAPFEASFGYCRAVRVGRRIWVSGTTSFDDDGNVVGPGDPRAQTERILAIIASALAQAGASLNDVVRTRIFTTDISRWEEIGAVHGKVFGDVRPASTLVEVPALIDPELMVEIEAEAVVPDPAARDDAPAGGDG
jgi:enamine deaminase RidA (YjgF/YER057c/UK114 family)